MWRKYTAKECERQIRRIRCVTGIKERKGKYPFVHGEYSEGKCLFFPSVKLIASRDQEQLVWLLSMTACAAIDAPPAAACRAGRISRICVSAHKQHTKHAEETHQQNKQRHRLSTSSLNVCDRRTLRPEGNIRNALISIAVMHATTTLEKQRDLQPYGTLYKMGCLFREWGILTGNEIC